MKSPKAPSRPVPIIKPEAPKMHVDNTFAEALRQKKERKGFLSTFLGGNTGPADRTSQYLGMKRGAPKKTTNN